MKLPLVVIIWSFYSISTSVASFSLALGLVPSLFGVGWWIRWLKSFKQQKRNKKVSFRRSRKTVLKIILWFFISQIGKNVCFSVRCFVDCPCHRTPHINRTGMCRSSRLGCVLQFIVYCWLFLNVCLGTRYATPRRYISRHSAWFIYVSRTVKAFAWSSSLRYKSSSEALENFIKFSLRCAFGV